MIYATFAVFFFFFEMASYCNMLLKKNVRNYQNCSDKIDPFVGELPNETRFANFWTIGYVNFDNLVL